MRRILVAAALACCAAAHGADSQRELVLQTFHMWAGRVLEVQQMVIAFHDGCKAAGLATPGMDRAFDAWTQRDGAYYAKVAKVVTPGFARKIDPSFAARDQVVAGMNKHFHTQTLNAFNASDAARKSSECGSLERRLDGGEFDVRRQQAPVFKALARIDLDNPGQYTFEQLLGMAR